jgi:hypothetical protein
LSPTGKTGSQSPTARSRSTWVSRTGPKRSRKTTLIFVLKRPALVDFVVIQVAPRCRRVGRFRVAGRAGRNRIPFRGRIGRRLLGPGTYRIKAQPLRGGRAVLDSRFVIATRPNKGEIAQARNADVCLQSASSSLSSAGSTAAGPAQKNGSDGTAPGRTERRSGSSGRRHGVLGARFAWAQRGTSGWLLALLGMGIGLLAVAALPLSVAPEWRVRELLARGRGPTALAGIGTILGVTVAYLLQ